MKARDLLAHLKTVPESDLDMDVQVWLPGSYIELSGTPFISNGNPPNRTRKLVVLIEGNIIEGSALCRS
jgi:hypothetical protein